MLTHILTLCVLAARVVGTTTSGAHAVARTPVFVGEGQQAIETVEVSDRVSTSAGGLIAAGVRFAPPDDACSGRGAVWLNCQSAPVTGNREQ